MNDIDQEIFEREIGMCRKLHAENGGWCRWGKCSECGVIPLLNKLAKGKWPNRKMKLSN